MGIIKKTVKMPGKSPNKTVKCWVWSKDYKRFLTIKEWNELSWGGNVVENIELRPISKLFNKSK